MILSPVRGCELNGVIAAHMHFSQLDDDDGDDVFFCFFNDIVMGCVHF